MSAPQKAYVGAKIHDGRALVYDHALVCDSKGLLSVLPLDAVPADCPKEHLGGGLITPGFVDLQVNGGGGVMFNEDQSVETLQKIAEAHATTGTLALLPTLITDTPDRTRAAIDAVEQAIAQKVEGIVGIHLEGPHLSVARKGAHDPSLIRPMSDDDLQLLLNAAERLANVMVTVAPENTTPAQISAMAQAGINVSLGHTDADVATCHAAFDAGARCATHLFNAMSQLQSREPGLVGATLSRGEVYAGLIADGIHVHPATMAVALAAKPHSERVFLVTDAMACAGSDITSFRLNGRQILRKDGRLTLEDGTLAGADLEMPRAIEVMMTKVGDKLSQAVRRATSTPAELLQDAEGLGVLKGARRAVYFPDGAERSITRRVLCAEKGT
ncbi:N-acetylglucosamine-6-phosphate deacetylase [Boseongicola aestuarii]|uniref:N-acetylglucosamine-6-phosphate deacetylase n=1 Tax=Boseongicola aestuarii TaxID=1470561 RepID=A0A238IYW6_9RHOB|nr:N-acetylglucosamine-6-phosphate deacetylase [Boseongicola aestuarii]SMX23678.1 N-acetylglucosamine-6-phosphate deacetylase [Boseongicola aestuarii]